MDPLLQAIIDGDLKTIDELLKHTRELARSRIASDRFIEAIPHWLYVEDTPLHLAAASLQVDVAKLLIKTGAEVNATNRRGAPPLHYACDPRPRCGTWNPVRQGQMIDLFVKHGSQVDIADRGGATALHRAVRARSPAAVRHLLRAGANINSRLGKHRSTPLHLAVQSTGAGGTAGAIKEQLEIIEILMAHGANPLAKDTAGKTVLDSARSPKILDALKGSMHKS